MAHYNRVALVGNVVGDPEIRYVGTGAAMTKFTIAVNRKSKEVESADYIDVVAWNKLAETSNTYLKRETLVLVEGRLTIRTYESKGGEKHTAAEVVMSLLQMLGRKTTSDGGNGETEHEVTSA